MNAAAVQYGAVQYTALQYTVRYALGAALSVVLFALPGCVKAPNAQLESGAAPSGASSSEALIEQAAAFARVNDQLRAEQYLNAALLSGGDEERILPLLLGACVADQRYRDAVQYVENHLRRHPSRHAARFLLASLQLAIGQTELARKELQAVVAAVPDHGEAQYALAVLLRDDIGDHVEADRHFRQYLRLRPAGSHAEEARGSLLSSLPRPSTDESRP
jgi:tetratricopeptide (TPR) repeat protein